jgi:hypothetical protein
MPGLKAAIASGNWSDPAIWENGLKPQAGDIVASNNKTVVIDEDITVSRLQNVAFTQSRIHPNMTSINTPAGYVVTHNGWTNPIQPFDGNNGTSGFGPVGNTTTLAWIAMEVPVAIPLGGYSFSTWSGSNIPVDWVIEGWNGSAWITLDTVVGNAATNFSKTFPIATAAYTKYRMYITKNNATTAEFRELNFYEAGYVSNAVAGGGFSITSAGRTVTLTQPMVLNTNMTQNTTLISVSYAGSGSTTISANLSRSSNNNWTGVFLSVVNSGAGGAVINFIGNVSGGSYLDYFIKTAGAVVYNHIGNVTGSSTYATEYTILIGASATAFNLTGNLIKPSANISASNVIIIPAGCTVTITGDATNLDANANTGTLLVTNGGTVNYIGNIKGGGVYGHNFAASFGGTSIVNHTGNLIGGDGGVGYAGCPAIVCTAYQSSYFLNGNLIFGNYGCMPMLIGRLFLVSNTSKYVEFATNSTSGALFPAAAPTRTQMVSPNTIVDSPAQSNVRNGVIYALGSMNGTLKVPNPNQVAVGIETDNTVGTAVITETALRNALFTASIDEINEMSPEDSFGKKIINIATVQSTGDQIAALIS